MAALGALALLAVGLCPIPAQAQAAPAPTGTLDERHKRIIPFRYDPLTVPYPVVRVSVNGRPPLPFVVDTGTSAALCLDPWAVAKLGLKPTGPAERSGQGFTYRQAPIRTAVLQGVGHGNVVYRISEATVIGLSVFSRSVQGPRVAGVVGLGMLASVTARFDFAARTLTVFTAPHLPLNIPGATVLPLHYTPDDDATVRVTLAPDTVADLILDTGSNGTQVPLAAAAGLRPTAISSGLVTRSSSLCQCPYIRLPSLNLGMLRVPDVEVSTLPPPGDVSLGLDILARYRVTLDVPNRQALLEPVIHGGHYRHGWSGVRVKPSGGGWSVEKLDPASPARQAGLGVGDELVSVGGVKIRGLSMTKLMEIFPGRAGMPVRVSVRRGGRVFTASWVTLDEFSAAPTALDGLAMRRDNGGPWRIMEVLEGSVGKRAGLRVGDLITHMNGSLVAGLSEEQCARLLAPSTLLLKVTRPGRAQPLTVRLTDPPYKPQKPL